MHRDLTFPFRLSIKCLPVKHTGFVLAQISCCSGQPAELSKGTATCAKVPYLKGTRRKIIQLPPSAKGSRRIPPLFHKLSSLPGFTEPSQPSKTPISLGFVAWERGRSIAVMEYFSGTFHYQGTVSLLQTRVRQLMRTKGKDFVSIKQDVLLLTQKRNIFLQVPILFKPCVTNCLMQLVRLVSIVHSSAEHLSKQELVARNREVKFDAESFKPHY